VVAADDSQPATRPDTGYGEEQWDDGHARTLADA
jgi:hypothetical protein